MELNELTQIWKSSDNLLDKTITVNKNMLKEVTANSVKSNLSEIKWNCIIEIILNYFFLDSLLGFTTGEYPDLKFVIPGIILLIFSAFGIALAVYKLILYYSINAKSNVIEAQKFAERLRYCELMEINTLYVIIPMFSVAILIVAAKAFPGVDLYTESNFLISYTIGSFIIGLIIIYLLKKFPNKKLQDTINFLKEIKENEKQF